jgi:hypothetical protein
MNWERSDTDPRGAIDRVLARVGYSAVIESIVRHSDAVKHDYTRNAGVLMQIRSEPIEGKESLLLKIAHFQK